MFLNKKKKIIMESKKDIEKLLHDAAMEDHNSLMEKIGTTNYGLSEEQIIENREKFGNNKVTEHKKDSVFKKLWDSFINPFSGILIFLAIISIYTDIILPDPEDKNAISVIIITAMVFISGMIRFVQEIRSGNAADSLLNLIKTKCTVIRENEQREILLEDLVVGDIVRLSAGDMIPADIRLIQTKDLFISQSSLTGENEPVEKTYKKAETEDSLTNYKSLAFLGSNVISGSAFGLVVATGDNTLFGMMAKDIQKEPVVTTFEKGVNQVSWVLIRFMLIMVPIVFVINGITKGHWIHAFTFAISIGVGLTPEMLPMIVTTCLAKGAVAMSKEKTIVKNLNSIQNFGSIDILCTDKTGTITQDKVILEYHLDVDGNDNSRVLRHAYLNSHFQTGLKNLMDIAIIESTNEEKVDDPSLRGLDEFYKKIDEVPFDFNRRRMSVVVEDKNGKTQMITKGAVEEMLSICSFVEFEGSVIELTDNIKEKVLNKVTELNDDGMRVIAIAQKTNPSPVGEFSVKDEKDMVLIGYLAFLDPPKESTIDAIVALAEYGVRVKVLTGDNEHVTRSICKMVGLEVNNLLTGSDIENMSEEELKKVVETTTVFAKVSPSQKAHIVELLRENGHSVGFMGDGINDAAAMKAADVGISVDTAVDIAKESADVILLEKDLMVLEKGIIEGRKTYANMIKYIKMTASSNFGNVFSVLIASAFIPYNPMTSIQLIFLNLIYDISCTAIPWDNVDKEFIKEPKKWDASGIVSFMLWLGPTSSIFDIATYLISYFLICPIFVPGAEGRLFNAIPQSEELVRDTYMMMAQSIWFVESMWTQSLVIHMIRTPKIPFIQSHASFAVTSLSLSGIVIATMIPFTPFGGLIDLYPFPLKYFYILAVTVVLYMILTTVVKDIYIKRYGKLL
ncbi:magnesium-translocating P-type ATPase [Miniphocaeibacter halophilus]|uniref:Magnesium-translocating P-type ATPase n=1 Tax=Miniphocaeibacter halophilus TaxID=2931922 RepID=A0AC61MP52_9FIRM|nr:magnesium-translocating P-type ATPase [Miniphocaeibacter halophilus]QQK07284.1 magnesium-translocating P-type ATPase [Miniphocaeibacter halophilus]